MQAPPRWRVPLRSALTWRVEGSPRLPVSVRYSRSAGAKVKPTGVVDELHGAAAANAASTCRRLHQIAPLRGQPFSSTIMAPQPAYSPPYCSTIERTSRVKAAAV